MFRRALVLATLAIGLCALARPTAAAWVEAEVGLASNYRAYAPKQSNTGDKSNTHAFGEVAF